MHTIYGGPHCKCCSKIGEKTQQDILDSGHKKRMDAFWERMKDSDQWDKFITNLNKALEEVEDGDMKEKIERENSYGTDSEISYIDGLNRESLRRYLKAFRLRHDWININKEKCFQFANDKLNGMIN